MAKFIPYEKLPKKKQRELNAKARGGWNGVNPVTRKPEVSKAYNRRKAQDWTKNSGIALLFCTFLRRWLKARMPGIRDIP